MGVISVLSNVLPRETSAICRRFFDGDVKGSAELQLRLLPLINALFSVEICNAMFRGDVEKAAQLQLDYLPLIDALFCEVNPIPVKAAMAAMGKCSDVIRLPLTKMEPAHFDVLLREMRAAGINV